MLIWLLANAYALWAAYLFVGSIVHGPHQAKCAFQHAQNTLSNHRAQAQNLFRAFALHWNILWYSMIPLADSEGPDQTAGMRRLILAFAVHILPKHDFAWRGLHNSVAWRSRRCVCTVQLLFLFPRRNQIKVSAKACSFFFFFFRDCIWLFYVKLVFMSCTIQKMQKIL